MDETIERTEYRTSILVVGDGTDPKLSAPIAIAWWDAPVENASMLMKFLDNTPVVSDKGEPTGLFFKVKVERLVLRGEREDVEVRPFGE